MNLVKTLTLNNMAKKKEVIEEPTELVVTATEETVVEETVVEETPAVEEFNPHQIGHATRAFRG